MVEAGAEKYGEVRGLLSVVILPHTSRLLGVHAAHRAMIDEALK